MTPAAVTFREVPCSSDTEAVRRIVSSTGFFQPFEVEVAVELVQERLDRGIASEYFFRFAEAGAEVVGYTCFGPIPCTISSVDLYWIAVDGAWQGKGLGMRLMSETEKAISAGVAGARPPFCNSGNGRRVYIETSGKELYGPTQRFYERAGFRLEARLESFYAPGDDKLVYVKTLA